MAVRLVQPQGVALTRAWERRFRALGWDRGRACRAAFSSQMHRAYDVSRIAYLPPELQHTAGWVVDVGANTGQWSRSFLTLVPTVRRLDAIEPLPTEASRLREDLHARFPQVQSTVHAVAVGAEDGTTATLSVAGTFSSLLALDSEVIGDYSKEQHLTSTTTLRVPMRTLDALFAGENGPVDLLKLDVQGLERQVLAGARHTLERTRCVLIEMNYVHHYQGDALLPDLWRLLERQGFAFWSTTPPFYGDSGRAMWADSVFVRKPLAHDDSEG